MKRTTKTGEHFYNFIAPLTITDYNDRGLGPSLCSLFTIREIKEYMPSYKVEFYLNVLSIDPGPFWKLTLSIS